MVCSTPLSLLVLFLLSSNVQADCCLCSDCAAVLVDAVLVNDEDPLSCGEFADVVFDLFEASSSQCLEVQEQQASCCPQLEQKQQQRSLWSASGWTSAVTNNNNGWGSSNSAAASTVNWGTPKPATNVFSSFASKPTTASVTSPFGAYSNFNTQVARAPPGPTLISTNRNAFGNANSQSQTINTGVAQDSFSSTLGCTVPGTKFYTGVSYHEPGANGFGARKTFSCGDAVRGDLGNPSAQMTSVAIKCGRVSCCPSLGQSGLDRTICGVGSSKSTGNVGLWTATRGGPK